MLNNTLETKIFENNKNEVLKMALIELFKRKLDKENNLTRRLLETISN